MFILEVSEQEATEFDEYFPDFDSNDNNINGDFPAILKIVEEILEPQTKVIKQIMKLQTVMLTLERNTFETNWSMEKMKRNSGEV
jgi:hypothetical protein